MEVIPRGEFRAFLKSSDEREGMGRMSVEETSGLREISKLGFRRYKADDEIVETSHDASSIAFGHTGSVFS